MPWALIEQEQIEILSNQFPANAFGIITVSKLELMTHENRTLLSSSQRVNIRRSCTV